MGSQTTSRLRTWGSYPLSQISFFDGTSIIYNNVVETITGSRGDNINNNDKITKKYYYATPYEYYKDNKRPLDIPFSIKKEYDVRERGRLVCLESYRNDTLVLRKKYDYQSPVLDTEIGKGIFILKPYQKTVVSAQYMTQAVENAKEYDGKQTILESRWPILKKETIEKYTQNNKKVVTEKTYSYQTEKPIFHKKPKRIEEKLNNGKFKILEYVYPTDSEAEQISKKVNFGISNLKRLSKYSLPIQIKETIGNASKYTQIKYNTIGLPKTIQTRLGNSGSFIEQARYTYISGKSSEVKEKDGVTTTYLWGYNNQYPIAKIRNATYAQIANIITIPNAYSYEPTVDEIKRINSLRTKLQHAEVTTYTYLPLVGSLTSITDPRGFTTYFENDQYGRLLKSYIKLNNTNQNLQEVKYNLVEKKTTGEEEPTVDPIENVEIILPSNQIRKNGQFKVEVNVEGGSGDFEYEWRVEVYKKIVVQDNFMGLFLIFFSKVKYKFLLLQLYLNSHSFIWR